MSSDVKHNLTKKLISFYPDEDRVDLEQSIKCWWMTPLSKPGMRLTMSGFDVFRKHLEFYMFETDDCLSKPRNLILLDKKMDCPYFIKRKSSQKFTLFIFGSQKAMMATLYGDIQKWLDSIG